MHHRSGVLGPALLFVTFAAVPLQAQTTFEWDGRLDRGSTLEVQSIVGDVHAVLASGDQIEVVATKRGRSADFGEVIVEMANTDDGIKFCVLYGSWNRGDEPCEHDNHDGRNDRSDRSLDVSVDFEVRIPAGVDFKGVTVSGNVEVIDVQSEVMAATVNGDVTVSTTEVAWANTVNGSIDLELGSTEWDDLHFNTVSGDITLRLPSGIDTDVEFQSLSGDFDSDFDVDSERRRRRLVGSRVRGTIGDGGRSLSFNTVSGDVTLLRTR